MAVVGIVFLPLLPAATIIDRLSSSFPSAVPSSLPSWSLSHTLYRSTSNPVASTLQLLRLSSHPLSLYIHTSGEQATTTVAIPVADESAFVRLLGAKLGALWTPVRGLDVTVTGGEGWLVGALAVRVGEVVATTAGTASGGSASGGTLKGSVVVVEQGDSGVNEETGEGDDDAERALLREFLVTAGVISGPDTPTVELWQRRSKVVEAWCEVLKHHGGAGRKVDVQP